MTVADVVLVEALRLMLWHYEREWAQREAERQWAAPLIKACEALTDGDRTMVINLARRLA